MEKPKTREGKLKLADTTLNVAEKLFLAPYLAVIGAFLSLDKLSFISALLLGKSDEK